MKKEVDKFVGLKSMLVHHFLLSYTKQQEMRHIVFRFF